MQPGFFYYRWTAALVVIAVFGAFVAGCDDGTASPEEVVRGFFGDLRAGEVERALESVWPPTRRELESAYDDLDANFDGEPPLERTDMLVVTRMESPMLISRMRIDGATPEAPSDGEELVVLVEFRDDRSTDVPLRWSGDDRRWYVDLPIDDRRPLQLIDDGEIDESDAPVDGVGQESSPVDRNPNDVENGTEADE